MRTYETTHAKRETVPLLIGLVSPSGAGKTMSALRLATGINRINKKKIFVIDSEARRSLWYADQFDFEHMEFTSPFSPEAYEGAIRHCVDNGAGTVIVDSFSHEWEGEGGVLSMHESEMQRLSKGDLSKMEKINFLAWAKPKLAHARMVNAILHMNCNFIFTFRSKEKLKIVPGKPPVDLGWQAIGAPDLIYEMSLNMILLPNAGGVPTWHSEFRAEEANMKLPSQFKSIFVEPKPLDESIGEELAKWAAGSSPIKKVDKIEADRTVNKLVTAFEELGVTRTMIETRLEKNLDVASDFEIKNLRKVYTEIKEGRSQWV